jgi:steroid 5-alpha reductase family enzyme
MLHHLLLTLAVTWAFMTAAFAVALRRRNNGVADTAWGLGFVLVAAANLAAAGSVHPAQVVLTVLVSLWGIRLACHVARRNRGKPEDFRYASMRARWGNRAALKSYTHVFLLQGFLLTVIAAPILLINAHPSVRFGFLETAGVAVWCVGFGIEVIADLELARFIRFRKTPGHRILDDGLWRYSRHPNYFGEALLWWGIFLLAVRVPCGGLGAVSPVVIGVLLRFVSGVPLLEKRHAGDAGYREYAARTPVFVPWFPKRRSGFPE